MALKFACYVSVASVVENAVHRTSCTAFRSDWAVDAAREAARFAVESLKDHHANPVTGDGNRILIAIELVSAEVSETLPLDIDNDDGTPSNWRLLPYTTQAHQLLRLHDTF